jgi:hypothetical protein
MTIYHVGFSGPPFAVAAQADLTEILYQSK